MFLGEYQHTIDAKGRVAVPARFRAKIERGAVLTRGTEPCLLVFPLETWERKAQALAAADLDARLRRYFERMHFGPATECELDAQGRLVLSPKLRQYAGLNGEALILGAHERFEIWSPARWETYLEEMRDADLGALQSPF
ncbi:MAG: division/cell wall cluster transcriptional repressor MraZ [Ktedonobacterales bacterium]|nr:division/cell wall cluster transcriptional repressor MraZ [Ktedonobacterales bacterium]